VGLLPAASGEGGGEYRLLGAATPGFDLAEERRLEVEAAERVRTLYVAMTRAKDRLVLAGDWPRQPRKPAVPDPGRSLEQARSHLQLLAWRAACPDLQRLWLAGGDGCLDQDGVAWRFPALRGGRLAADAEAIGAMGAAGAIAATAAIAGTAAAVVAGAADDAAGTAGGASLAAPAEVASQAALLAFRRAAAAARMARPYGAAASEEAHAQLREAVAAGEAEERGADADTAAAGRSNRRRAAALAAGREAAMASGAALHRALELWDLAAEPAREAERQRALLPAYLSAVAAAEDVARALPRSRRLLERFVAGGLAARLRGLAGRVLARELPVLLAPGPEPPGDAGGTAAAVAFVSGTVDLLYRDPGSGELVIADYKTDDVSGAELERRTAIYASQGAAYVRAVQSALGLAAPPRFELWFVHAGEVVAAAPP
jgi:ATP-dependent exoDNAse (exonuclease V) beta subunit